MAVADMHPDIADLEAFTLGTLDDASLADVESHVADCPTCQERAAGASGDTLVELLRRVHAQSAHRHDTVTEAAELAPTPAPVPVLTEGLTLPPSADDADAVDGIPPELARHERYRVRRLLGAGGMGSVYEAEHRVMQRAVAVKVINRAFTTSPAAVERFRREVRAAAKLSHPNIVSTHDAEDAGHSLFLVMEYVEGISLARLVKEGGPLPVAQACDYVRQAALGLQHAHERGMVHRDIKPDNLMLVRPSPERERAVGPNPLADARGSGGSDGVVKVLDFGLASLTAERGSGLTETNVIKDTPQRGSGLTEANVVMGTPDYMAPEQAEDARRADIRADVYSLGCTLYFLLTGSVPYPADTSLLKILAHREQPLPSLRKVCPAVPPELAAVVARLLAKQPEDRYQTPAEVAAALEPFTRTSKPGYRKRGRKNGWQLAAAVLFAGLIAAAGAVFYIKTDNGTIEIQTDDENVKIIAEGNGKQLTVLDPKSKQTWVVDTGEWTVRLDGNPDGLKLEMPNTFKLKRGDKQVVTVKRMMPLAEKVGEVRRFPGFAPGWVTAAEFSRDGRRVVALAWDLRVWNAATGELLGVMGNVHIFGWGLALAPDGKTAYQSSDKGVVRIYDLEKAEEVGHLDAPSNGPSSLELSADGKRILITVVHVWKHRLVEVPSGKELAHFEGGQAALSPDGTRVALSRGKRIVLWDVASDKEVGGFDTNQAGPVNLRFTQDGRSLVVSGPEIVRIWDVATGKVRSSFTVPDVAADTFVRLGVSPDGRRILTGLNPTRPGRNPPIILWDVETAMEVCRFSGPEAGIFALAFAPDGRSAIATGDDGTVCLLRLPEPTPPEKVGEVRRFQPHDALVNAVAFSPEGRFALSGTGDGVGTEYIVRLWDVQTGKEVRRLEGHTGHIWGVAFSPDGKRILSCSQDRTVRLWDAESGKEIKSLEGHTEGVLAAVFSPDGKRVLSGGADKTARLWDLESGKELKLLDGHTDAVRRVAFSPDGKRALSGSFDTTVRLWDLDTGAVLKTLEGHTGMVHGVAFLPDGRRAVSCAHDKSIRLWDLESGKQTKEIAGPAELHDLALAADGRRLLTATLDSTLRLWDLESGKELHSFAGHRTGLSSAAISPDGHYALSGAADRTMRLWRLPDPLAAEDKP
jgi:WD40 repeat protein/serine/threonine protein kinase